MAEHPFWDDDCLRGSIDRVPLPPPPRSLFEHDLFCYEEDIDNLPPLDNELTMLPESPVLTSPSRQPLPTPIASPKHLQNLLTKPASPVRPWRSFMDDNCPLRKRVKVTITQLSQKRESPQNNVQTGETGPLRKKRRVSPNSSGPRRLQTTLRLPKPGDPTPRLALQIPSDGKSDTRVVASRKSFTLQQPRPVSQPALPQRRCITNDLTARLHSMKMQTGSVTSKLSNRLPLVDAAVQAVSRAAQAYRQALGSVAVFPSAAVSVGKSKIAVKAARERESRRRKGKKRRTLLSFDDKEVAPLAEDRGSSETSALFNYLNSPSSWQTTVF